MNKNRTRSKDCCKTEFSCCAPGAEAVFLAGTFNDWNEDEIPMEKGDDGNWHAKIELPPGRHEFKYVVDGQWHCESNCVPNDFGTMNQVVEV